jgi:hypothetical protein
MPTLYSVVALSTLSSRRRINCDLVDRTGVIHVPTTLSPHNSSRA